MSKHTRSEVLRAGAKLTFIGATGLVLSGCNNDPTPTFPTTATPNADSPKWRLVSPGKLPSPELSKNGFRALEKLGLTAKDINTKMIAEVANVNDISVLFYTNALPGNITSVNEGVKIPVGYFLCITGNYTATGLDGLNPLEPEKQAQAKLKKGGAITENTSFSCYSCNQKIYGLQIGSNTSLAFLTPQDLKDLFPDQ